MSTLGMVVWTSGSYPFLIRDHVADRDRIGKISMTIDLRETD
jgi:hypothetical protein